MGSTKIKPFQPIKEEVEKIGKACLDAAFKVHTTLGPGLLKVSEKLCKWVILRD
jgi:hypothetical protein